MRRVNAMLVALLVTTGCASTSTIGLARTLNRGAVQGWVAGEGGGIIVPSATNVGTGYPMVEGGVRVGASDHVELGARLGFNGLGLEGKFALVRSATMDSGLNLSLNPMVGFFGVVLGNVFGGNLSLQLPVLVGIDFAGHELVFGPRLHDQIYFGGITGSGGAGAINLLSAGGSVGIALKAGPVRILPEVSVLVPFFGTGAVTGSSASSGVGVGGFFFQAGVGVLFGSRDSYERSTPPAPPPPPAYEPPPLPPPLPPPTPPDTN